MRSKTFLMIVSGLVLFLSSNCGGSSGRGGEATGLEIAEQIALVTPQESSGEPSLKKIFKMAAPTSGDYVTDVAEVYVYDQSMEVLDFANEIFCMVDQTRYSDLVNQGDYIALIDQSLCARRDDKGGESGDRSSAEEQSFETWIVNSARASGNSRQIVQFWLAVEPDEEDPFDEIRAELVITEGRSDDNPFGVFSINFVGFLEGVQFLTANLSSEEIGGGLVELKMMIDGGEFFQDQTHAIFDPDGSAGQAYASFTDSSATAGGGGGTETGEVRVAFDESHYFANMDGEIQCLDRLNFDEHVWEYNLYDPDGARASLNGGFGIRYGEDIWGWAGYYGIWLPEDQVEVVDGLEVRRADDDTPYTVYQGAGRLIRRTRNTLQLADFIGDQFHHWHPPTYGNTEFVWDWDLMNRIFIESTDVNAYYNEEGIMTIEAKEMGAAGNAIALEGTGGFAVSGPTLTGGDEDNFATGTVVIGELADGDTLTIGSVTYTKVAEANGEEMEVVWNGENFVKIGVQECGDEGCVFTPTDEEVLTFGCNDWVGLWKDGLGSLDLVVPDEEEGCEITNEMIVPYRTEEFVSPTDDDVEGGLTLECYYACPKPNLTADDLNAGNPFYDDVNDEGGEPYTYTFSADDYTLRFNGEPVTIEEGADLSGGPYNWGMRSGAMVADTVAVNDPWEVHEQDVTYEWETGPNHWNRYQTLLDSDGLAAQFDRPLNCLYQDAERGTFFLNYEGEGNLHGIPWEEVATEEGWTYWVPSFSLADGTELECDGSLYYTRAMAKEQRMQVVDLSACSDLSFEDIGPPDNEFVDPEMGEAPEVTSAPAVIGGVLQ